MNVSIIIVGSVIVFALSVLAYWANNKKPKRTSKIKKSMEQDYKAMNEAEFQKDMNESTTDFFETKEPNENSQETGSIYLSKKNYQDHLFLDVVAFSCAQGGAQGVGGEIIVIARDASIYRMNYVYGNMSMEMCEMVCPPLRECMFGFFDVEEAPFGWKGLSLGAGNYLVLEDSLYDRLREKIAEMSPYELYGEWMGMVLNAVKDAG